MFDQWFSERSLVDAGDVRRVVERLREREHVYEHDGALWFRSTAFGDEKDRVVIRENGESTYFASDIAYAANKFVRGFERAIYVWGADHHGYIARVKAAVEALGYDRGAVEILLVQFANLYRGGERVQMSTRSGEFVTLRELRDEVGADAARFFYVMRRCEQHLDFDLELAKSRSNDNPVYYVQYAHARIASVLRQCEERGMVSGVGAEAAFHALVEAEPVALMRTLARYPEVLALAAEGARAAPGHDVSSRGGRAVARVLQRPHVSRRRRCGYVERDCRWRWRPGTCLPTGSRCSGCRHRTRCRRRRWQEAENRNRPDVAAARRGGHGLSWFPRRRARRRGP